MLTVYNNDLTICCGYFKVLKYIMGVRFKISYEDLFSIGLTDCKPFLNVGSF